MKDAINKLINDKNPTEKNILIIFIILLAIFLLSFLIVFSLIYTFFPDLFEILLSVNPISESLVEKMNNAFLYLLVILIISTFLEVLRKKISSKKKVTDTSYELIFAYLILKKPLLTQGFFYFYRWEFILLLK